MIAADLAYAYLNATPMVATLRLDGVPVGTPMPVVWEQVDGRATFTAKWKLDAYTRMDEAVILAGDLVVVGVNESRELALPPGAEYVAEFVFVVQES